MNLRGLTENKDVDRKILDELNDADFIKMCVVNKHYYENICNEEYFRIRTYNKYPETIPYKSENTSWKDYFLSIVNHIYLLQKDYKTTYQAKYKNPKLLYNFKKYSLSKSGLQKMQRDALFYAITYSDLEFVKYIIENGFLDMKYIDEDIEVLTMMGNIEIFKYVINYLSRIYPKETINGIVEHSITRAIQRNNASFLKYVLENFNIDMITKNTALIKATRENKFEIITILIDNGADPNYDDGYVFNLACKNGYLSIVKYLSDKVSSKVLNSGLRLAIMNNQQEVIQYIASVKD